MGTLRRPDANRSSGISPGQPDTGGHLRAELPDGTWKDLLEQIVCMKYAPELVVSSRMADEVLWSEALNLGAYSVLSKPLDMKEVFHVVSFAWLNWKRHWEPCQRYTPRDVDVGERPHQFQTPAPIFWNAPAGCA